MTLLATLAVMVAGGGALALWLGRRLRDQGVELAHALGGVAEASDRRLAALEEKVDRRLEGLDGRLLSTQESAGKTATEIVARLGKLDGTAAQMLARANDLARLEHALRPPKARGGVGEILLGNLLRDSLPPDAYRLQHTFRTGERVDAVIRVDKLVPVDAKFPLDNFERLVTAGDEEQRALHEKAFVRDVRTHVDAIASKYILPAEGTYDFALMYLPAESVYYELVCGTGNAYGYALGKRVFPVSPTTLHAYLLVITLGLKGLQIEQHAQEVMAYCGQLARDFERFRGDFDVVGKHISNAQSKYGEADRRLERLGARLERATDWQDAVEPPAEARELPRAVDAA
ncbi:MAG TPA: DNA recombination protein RmuC [Gaiellaceae bacterium]|nr:DNA recombination protein RmuC [Gaiellaceae bacterium]